MDARRWCGSRRRSIAAPTTRTATSSPRTISGGWRRSPGGRAGDRRILSLASGSSGPAVGVRHRARLALVQLSDRARRPRQRRRRGQLGAGRRAAAHASRVTRSAQRGVTMSVTVTIPTPLRSFTGGRDAVELPGATVGRGDRRPALRARRSQAAPGAGRRPAPQLREPLPERHRHSAPRVGVHAGPPGRRADHRAQHRGRQPGGGDRAAQALPQRGAPLLAAPAAPRSRGRGAAEAQGGTGADHRRRRAGLAALALPRRGGRGHDRHRGFRRRGPHQPPAADRARHLHARPAQAGVGQGAAHRPQSEPQGRVVRDPAQLGERARHHRRVRHRRGRDRQLSRPATS